MLLQDDGSELREALDELHNRAGLELRAGVTVARESSEARVGLTEDGMAVTGDNAARLESVPEVVGDLLVARVVTDVLLELKRPVEHLLVGETVERASETVEGSGVREVGVRERRADKVSSVGRDVATLVVAVDSDVKTEVVSETLLVAVAELVREVLDQVTRGVDNLLAVTLAVDVEVDARGDRGELGNEIKRVLEGGLPVLSLLDAAVVRVSELAVVVEGRNSRRELGHGVQALGERVNDLLNVLRELGTRHEVLREALHLLRGGDLASKDKPEHRLGEHLSALVADAVGVRELLLALGNALTVEGDTLVSVKNRALPEHDLKATHTTKEVAYLDLTEVRLGMLSLQLGELLALLRHDLSEGLLERLCRRVAHRSAGRRELAGSNSGAERSTRDIQREHNESGQDAAPALQRIYRTRAHVHSGQCRFRWH